MRKIISDTVKCRKNIDISAFTWLHTYVQIDVQLNNQPTQNQHERGLLPSRRTNCQHGCMHNFMQLKCRFCVCIRMCTLHMRAWWPGLALERTVQLKRISLSFSSGIAAAHKKTNKLLRFEPVNASKYSKRIYSFGSPVERMSWL